MDSNIDIHSADKIEIDNLTNQFFNLFNNTNHKIPDWAIIQKICIPEIIIIKKTGLTEVIYSLTNFIEPRKTILSDGTLTNFQEQELHEVTQIIGHIAHRQSRYQKSGNLYAVVGVQLPVCSRIVNRTNNRSFNYLRLLVCHAQNYATYQQWRREYPQIFYVVNVYFKKNLRNIFFSFNSLRHVFKTKCNVYLTF